MMSLIQLFNGDCLEVMDELIEKGVKVDVIITDPPYGVTACKWDSVIPFEEMWTRLNKLVKDNGAIVLFGSEPFSSTLRLSNLKNFKYDWIWEKPQGVNPLLSKKQPLNNYEVISVFYRKQVLYNPQFEEGKPYIVKGNKNKQRLLEITGQTFKRLTTENTGYRYPKRVLKFNQQRGLHPTQKPVALLEYLIKTYTLEGETVLDFTMGSGSTGVACQNTGRHFIGIELDENYFNIAKERMNK